MVVGTIAKRLRPLKSPLSSSVCALCATPHTAAFAFHVAFTVLVFVCPQYVRPSVRPRRRRRRRGPSTFLLSPSRRTRGGGSAAVTKHNLTSDIDLVEAGKAVALHMCSIRCQRQCQQPPDCKWPISGNDEVTSETCRITVAAARRHHQQQEEQLHQRWHRAHRVRSAIFIQNQSF